MKKSKMLRRRKRRNRIANINTPFVEIPIPPPTKKQQKHDEMLQNKLFRKSNRSNKIYVKPRIQKQSYVVVSRMKPEKTLISRIKGFFGF